MIVYTKLFDLMKEKQISTYFIKKTGLISQQSYQNIKTGKGGLDNTTLNRLCKTLQCQPGDLMEYIEDEE